MTAAAPRLAGKVAVVTGAASGIGRAAARAFALEGATVGLLDRASAEIGRLARELGPGAIALPADVTDEDAVAGAFDALSRRVGGLHALLTCAAVQFNGRDARAHELDLTTWHETLAVNLTGVFLSCKHAIPRMRESGGGSIIVCGSPTGVRGVAPGYDAYSASKGGAMALARVLAADYAADGIRVNVIVPGTTDTPLIQANIADPERRRGYEANIPLGRLGTPEDYVELAVWLASDASAFATGAEFVVDGGVLAR